MQNKNGNITFKHQFFFLLFLLFRHNTQVQWLDVSAYWCNLIYMSAMHFFFKYIAFIFCNTPLHILLFVPSSQFVNSAFYYFFYLLLLRKKLDGDCR